MNIAINSFSAKVKPYIGKDSNSKSKMKMLARISKNKEIVKKPVKRPVFDFDYSNNSRKGSQGMSSVNRDVTMSPKSPAAGETASYKTLNQGSPSPS